MCRSLWVEIAMMSLGLAVLKLFWIGVGVT
jgi:hypothetical protein